MTPPEDYDRAAEGLKHSAGQSIIDRDTFQIKLEAWTTQNKMTIPDSDANDRLWAAYRNLTGLKKGSLHKRKGGKDLKRDKLYRAKDTVTDKTDYKDARRQDLEGYDTPENFVYDIPGRQGKRVVFARRITATIDGKQVNKFIGRNGKPVVVSQKRRK